MESPCKAHWRDIVPCGLAEKNFHERDRQSMFDDCTDVLQEDIFHIVARYSDPEVLKFLVINTSSVA